MEPLKTLLNKATLSAKIYASREKIPLSISENGKVQIGKINNRGKVIYKSLNSK